MGIILSAEIELNNPIVLCGGMMNDKFIFKAIEIGVGAVTLGTYSSSIRSNHPKPWLYRIPSSNCFVNSYGIRHNYKEKETIIKQAISEAKKRDIIIICSYIEKSPEESQEAINFFENVGCDVLEINPTPLLMGCSNEIALKGLYKEENLIELIENFIHIAKDSSLPISVKFPSTILNVNEAWKRFKRAGASIAHIMNAAIPAYVLTNDGEIYFRTESGMGGLTGECIKPLSLARVKILSSSGEKKIIGTGGVLNIYDVKNYLNSGAAAVGVHSIIYAEGFAGLNKLIEESKKLFRK